ncbi:MAG: hypothetical protein R2838_20530 [Caldilineaceae bacterium]
MLVVVNDGSTDGTAHMRWHRLQCTLSTPARPHHRRSGGMTNALERMFAASAGDIVILIPPIWNRTRWWTFRLVNHMEATDLDVVAGWRQGRKDGKVFAHNIYNLVMRKLMAVPVHDGNWIKAMRRDVVESLPPLRSD